MSPCCGGAPQGSTVDAIAVRRSSDAAGRDELCQNLSDVAGAHARGVAQSALRQRCFRLSENLFDALPSRWLGGLGLCGLLVYQLESKRGRVGLECELQTVGAGSGAMFDAQMQMRTGATQIQVGVAPGVEFRRSTQCLTAALMGGAFAGMVHQRHGGAVMALQTTQIAEQRRDLGGDVLINCMQTDQRIEHEQFWL